MPAIRQVQKGAGVPGPLPLRRASQIILQAVRFTDQFVRNTINSEPTNIDGQTMKSWMGVARVCAPDGLLLRHALGAMSACPHSFRSQPVG